MSLSFRLALGVLGALAVILVALAVRSTEDARAGPPLTGWMESFTPARESAPAPRLAFTDPAGRNLGSEDFRGKLVLVNFWATWCAPCIREMPTLGRLHARLGGDDFAVLALSEDRKGWEVIAPFAQKHDLAGVPLYHDPGGRSARALGVKGLPTTVLLDRDGRELGRLTGIAEWDSDEAVTLMRYYLAR